MRPQKLECACREEEKQGECQDMRVEVSKEEAPERVFIDRLGHDSGGGPEVVPVEMSGLSAQVLIHQPLSQPGQIAKP